MSLGAVACSDDSSGTIVGPSETSTTLAQETNTATSAPTTEVAQASTNDTSLTDTDLDGLLWMREEEQLAHDVYVTLGYLWGLRIFENIAASETTHIDAARAVLDGYDLVDPAADNDLGTFTNPQIQDLFDRLVAEGSSSVVAALEVGAFIEELDIVDLRVRDSATEEVVLTELYAQLEHGSRNHLRAFTSQLEARDVTYEPTQLDVDAYEAIVSTPMERGRDA
jgi:hypothetical protein